MELAMISERRLTTCGHKSELTTPEGGVGFLEFSERYLRFSRDFPSRAVPELLMEAGLGQGRGCPIPSIEGPLHPFRLSRPHSTPQ